MTEFDSSIQVDDSDRELQDVKCRIANRIAARRKDASERGLDYDHLTDEDALVPGSGEAGVDYRARLRELDVIAQQLGVSPAVRDRQFPVLNRLFFKIEMLLHKLVVKYVNRIAGRQLVFNKGAIKVMSDLGTRLEQQDKSIAAMQTRMSDLERRVAELEQSNKSGQ